MDKKVSKAVLKRLPNSSLHVHRIHDMSLVFQMVLDQIQKH